MKLSESAANFLTNAAYDPESKIPEYKVCAVRVDPAEGEGDPSSGRRRRGRREAS